jgi:hypothetical protein
MHIPVVALLRARQKGAVSGALATVVKCSRPPEARRIPKLFLVVGRDLDLVDSHQSRIMADGQSFYLLCPL